MELVNAQLNDLEEILALFSDAKKNMSLLGISQWTNSYPDTSCILSDITTNDLKIMRNELGEILAIGTFTQTPDKYLKERCSNNVWFIKRLVSTKRLKGKSNGNDWIELCLDRYCDGNSKIYSITNHTNWPMQKLFQKSGFTKIGETLIPDRISFGKFYIYERQQ